MNPQDQIHMSEDSLHEIDLDSTSSVDDFIRELEEKERDLHITADLSIEISDIDLPPAQSFFEQDIAASIPLKPANASPTAPPKPTEAASAAVKTRNLELENEVVNLKLRINELKNERAEQQEKSDRRLKDFENYKYRMDRERRGAFIDQIANLATQMLPVLDNLNRAIDSVPAHAEQRDPAFSNFFDGIVLVSQQVNEVFAGMGVEPIRSVNEPFDPNFHEAVAIEERPDLLPNMITQELLAGYRIGNKVIRHSMVKVTTGAQRQAPQPQEPPSIASSSTQTVSNVPNSDTGSTLEPKDFEFNADELGDLDSLLES